MNFWNSPIFWLIWLNQIVAFFVVIFLVAADKFKRNLTLMMVVSAYPAIILLFNSGLANMGSNLLQFLSCSLVVCSFIRFFPGFLKVDYQTLTKSLIVATLINSLTALSLTGVSKVMSWQTLFSWDCQINCVWRSVKLKYL
jgi:hypothetical protein